MERVAEGTVVLRGYHITDKDVYDYAIREVGLRPGGMGLFGSGVYAANITAPATVDYYTKHWRNGFGYESPGQYERVRLLVEAEVPAEEIRWVQPSEVGDIFDNYLDVDHHPIVVVGGGVVDNGERSPSGYQSYSKEYGSAMFDVGQWRVRDYPVKIVAVEELQ